ncbi:MAG: metal-sensing transcriptional repressor [Eubacteriales bacterium]|nr:metal-sensing transcriptional repressor [Eubacteriales bacterium]
MQADRKKVERLLKTARGQIDGILRMVEEDRYCMDISAQIMATDAILRKVNNEVIRAHMKGCVKSAILDGAGDEKIDELMQVVDKLSR